MSVGKNINKQVGQPGQPVMRDIPVYGGQAVIEGVLMRGTQTAVLCVREPGGHLVTITKEVVPLSKKNLIYRIPILRGALTLWDSLSLGIEMLIKSAEISAPEEIKPGDKTTVASVVAGVFLALGLFLILPSIAAPYILGHIGITTKYALSFFETSMRIVMLVSYVVLVSRMNEIQRVLEYHGAEHKVIWALEKTIRKSARRSLGKLILGM